MRTCSAVEYEWISGLVPRLSSADAARLAGRAPGSKWDPATGQQIDEAAVERAKLETDRIRREKREQEVAEAKRRYAERKKERTATAATSTATAAAAAPAKPT